MTRCDSIKEAVLSHRQKEKKDSFATLAFFNISQHPEHAQSIPISASAINLERSTS